MTNEASAPPIGVRRTSAARKTQLIWDGRQVDDSTQGQWCGHGSPGERTASAAMGRMAARLSGSDSRDVGS